MQFIQEEMENFLAHLARSGEHDKQVRTMNQAGLLAQDCNCTDLYLYGCTAGTRTSTAPRAGSGATLVGLLETMKKTAKIMIISWWQRQPALLTIT